MSTAQNSTIHVCTYNIVYVLRNHPRVQITTTSLCTRVYGFHPRAISHTRPRQHRHYRDVTCDYRVINLLGSKQKLGYIMDEALQGCARVHTFFHRPIYTVPYLLQQEITAATDPLPRYVNTCCNWIYCLFNDAVI